MKAKIINFFHKIKNALAPYKKNIIIPLLKILLIIIVCVILVKLITGGKTLTQYAEENPEIAYRTETSISK